jgi:hypothetical protein
MLHIRARSGKPNREGDGLMKNALYYGDNLALLKVLPGMTALCVAVLIALGRFTPEIVPDTPGYLEILEHGFPAVLALPRTPLYGWLVAVLDMGRGSYILVPLFQIATYLAACWLWVGQLRAYGLSQTASLSVGVSLLSANALLMDAGWVHPELPAITCALLAFAGTVHLAGSRPRWWGWLLVCAGAGCAYTLRPSFLPLIAALPALFLCLRAIRSEPLHLRRAAIILLVSAFPFIGIASIRAATVGDPNITSFGGYVMAGTATLMLSDEVVARLPDDIKPFATQVLSERRAGEDNGQMIGIPLNASKVRSFPSVVLAYFDVMARTHDDMLAIISATRAANESWVDFNRRLTRFSLAVIYAAPDRYAMWVVGASGRMFGRSVTTNLPAALAILVVVVAWPWRLFVRGKIGVTPVSRLDIPIMIVAAVLWLVAAGPLTVLLHAPATRFIETSSLLVAPALIYWAVLLLVTQAEGKIVGQPQ